MKRIKKSLFKFLSFYSTKWSGPKYLTSRKNCGRTQMWLNAKNDLAAVTNLIRDERIIDLSSIGTHLKLENPEQLPNYVNTLVQRKYIRIERWDYVDRAEEKTPVEKYIPDLQSSTCRFLAFTN